MKRVSLLVCLLAAGCYDPMPFKVPEEAVTYHPDLCPPDEWEMARFKEWQPRWESFENFKVGMDFKDVYAIWGGQSDSHRSVIGGTEYLSLIYRCNVRRDGYVMGRPVKTYSLDFINGKLTAWHEY